MRYVKIAEGCDSGCGFCIIPQIRGPQRSISPEVILREAQGLLRSGAKELILVAQDSTAYGLDTQGAQGLPSLLEAMGRLVQGGGGGERWVRVLYLHPAAIDGQLIAAMAHRPVLPYFDLALQHSSPRVLKHMRRPSPRGGWQPLIDRIRHRIPDAVFRATLLIGHPGETAHDFNDLLKFVEDTKLDRVGVFTYDPQQNTPSASLPAPPSGEVEARLSDLVALLSEQAAARIPSMIGRRLTVLIDHRSQREHAAWGRPWTDAPDVDWVYELPSPLPSGSFVEADVVDGNPGHILVAPAAA